MSDSSRHRARRTKNIILIHTQQNATSYAYLHRYITDQTHYGTGVHNDSNTYLSLHFVACTPYRHNVNDEELGLCLYA